MAHPNTPFFLFFNLAPVKPRNPRFYKVLLDVHMREMSVFREGKPELQGTTSNWADNQVRGMKPFREVGLLPG